MLDERETADRAAEAQARADAEHDLDCLLAEQNDGELPAREPEDAHGREVSARGSRSAMRALL